MLEVRFYDKIEDSQLDFAVIIAKNWRKMGILQTQRKGITYEVPGGTQRSRKRPLKKRQEEGTF